MRKKLHRAISACILGVLVAASLGSTAHAWQGMSTPRLHVEGRHLKDPNGKSVLLHGWMQPTATWFNGQGRWYSDPSDWNNPANVAGLLNYLRGAATLMSTTNALYGRNHGWNASFVRVNTDTIGGWTSQGGLVNSDQFNGWIQNFIVPYADHLRSNGLYLVLSATGPINTPNNGTRNAGVVEQQRLITFWQTVANAAGVKNADNIMFELMNEPVDIESSPGNGDWGNHAPIYFLAFRNWIQPVIDVIRNTGAENVIWVPTLEWQGSPHQHALYPFTGTNCGIAAHYYPAYGGVFDNAAAVQNLWNTQYKPAADLWPMMITEMFWTPFPDDPWNLVNGTTAGFGNAIRNAIDQQGNVSYLVGFLGDLLDDLNDALPAGCTLSTREGAQAFFDWLPAYAWAAPGGGPSGLNAVATSATAVLLTWNPFSGATHYNVKRSTGRGGPYTTVAAGVTATNYTDTVTAGIEYHYVVSATTVDGESPNSPETRVNPPYPWISRDIGATGLAGSASFDNGVFTLRGSGADIWGTSDAFRFVSVPVTGNCVISARVLSVQNVDPWSKAGIMIRESSSANAAHALVTVTPGNGIAWQVRSATGGTTSNANTPGLAAPHWVRLVRSGNTFTGFRSADGISWTQSGSATIAMASTVHAGLALTSHNNSALCLATFDNVTVPGWPDWTVPPAPSGVTASAADESVALSWTASDSAAGYNVRRATTQGGPYALMADVTTTNYTDSGLVNGTPYYYVVSALNPAGEGPGSLPVGATPEPLRPKGVSATAVSISEIQVSWNALSNAASYRVKRSVSDGGPYETIASGLTETHHLDGGLSGGTVYYYVVRAIVDEEETSDSAQVSAATHSPVLGSLVHRYSFSETGGTTTADSVGGPVWNGVLPNGGTFSGGRLNLASGFLQHVRLPAGVVSSLSNCTVMAWVNLVSVSPWSRLFEFGSDMNTYMFLTPQNGFDQTARFALSTTGAGGEQKINCPIALSPGAWRQVAVTLNAGKGVLYIDGVAVGTNSNLTITPSNLGTTTLNFIGRSLSGTEPTLNGALDEFRIYNTALSPAEIAATVALGPDQLLDTNPPQISVSIEGAQLVLSWPLAMAGYALQSCTNLVSGEWADVVSPAPEMIDGNWRLLLPVSHSDASTFYRIVK